MTATALSFGFVRHQRPYRELTAVLAIDPATEDRRQIRVSPEEHAERTIPLGIGDDFGYLDRLLCKVALDEIVPIIRKFVAVELKRSIVAHGASG